MHCSVHLFTVLPVLIQKSEVQLIELQGFKNWIIVSKITAILLDWMGELHQEGSTLSSFNGQPFSYVAFQFLTFKLNWIQSMCLPTI